MLGVTHLEQAAAEQGYVRQVFSREQGEVKADVCVDDTVGRHIVPEDGHALVEADLVRELEALWVVALDLDRR